MLFHYPWFWGCGPSKWVLNIYTGNEISLPPYEKLPTLNMRTAASALTTATWSYQKKYLQHIIKMNPNMIANMLLPQFMAKLLPLMFNEAEV